MKRPERVLIIGGGIAGPATAMALQFAGIESVIYEARPAGDDLAGVFLTVASNGLDALRLLGADTAVRARGFATPAITLRSGSGKRLGETRISSEHGTPSRTIRRADLYRALRDEAIARGVRFEHGKRLVDAKATGEGVRAVFADGTDATGDLIVGCDGIHSAVRRVIDPSAPAPAYAGLVGTGGYAHGVEVDVSPGTYEMIFGKRAFFGYVKAPDGAVWWFANLPRKDEPARGETDTRDNDTRRETLTRLFAGDAGPALPVIGATPEIMEPLPIHLIPHLPRWHNERMVVIGDAAHAPSPTSGQGASLAIEDAVVLARCLRDLPDHLTALDRFEAERRPRVEEIIKWAARVNNSKAPGPVGRFMRDAILPVVLRLTANNETVARMYDYRIDWDARAAGAGAS